MILGLFSKDSGFLKVLDFFKSYPHLPKKLGKALHLFS